MGENTKGINEMNIRMTIFSNFSKFLIIFSTSLYYYIINIYFVKNLNTEVSPFFCYINIGLYYTPNRKEFIPCIFCREVTSLGKSAQPR